MVSKSDFSVIHYLMVKYSHAIGFMDYLKGVGIEKVKNARILTEGAVLLAIYIILLLIYLYIPIVSLPSTLFLVLPFLLYSAKNPLKYSIVFFIASIIISALVGTFLSIPAVFLFGTTGIVMGCLIQSKKSSAAILMASSLTFLANLVLAYIISIKFFHFNFFQRASDSLRKSYHELANMEKSLGVENSKQMYDQMNEALNLMQSILPTCLVVMSFIMVGILMAVNFPIVRRFKINAPKWQPFHKMQLPKSMIWYYVIIILLSLFIHPQAGNYIGLALLNLGLILQLLMLLQGISFIFYYGYMKKWSKGILILISIFSIIWLPLRYMVILLGIMDLGAELRKKIKGK